MLRIEGLGVKGFHLRFLLGVAFQFKRSELLGKGLRFRVDVLKVQCLRCRASRVFGLGFMVEDLGFRIDGWFVV